MATTKLSIGGMTCGHCVTKVENGLNALEGMYSVHVDLEDASAEIDHADTLSNDVFIAAVSQLGYKAEVAS